MKMKLFLLTKVLLLALATSNDLHAHAQEDSNNPVIHALRGSVVSIMHQYSLHYIRVS